MRILLLLMSLLFSTGTFAQQAPETFGKTDIFFSGDTSSFNSDKDILELTGNVRFSTSIVEINQADKIIYNKKTKEFTISGFKELRINGKVQLAEDLGPTTLKFELGTCVAYLVAEK